MLFTPYFNDKYNVRIIYYRTDAGKLSGIMGRMLSSAGILIFNSDLKKRVNQLKIMIKNKTLDRNIAILRSARGIGDVRLKRLIIFLNEQILIL